MIVDLPACAGCFVAVTAARAGRPAGLRGPGMARLLAGGWAEAAIERERRATLAMVITDLPPGYCVIDRDGCGRERFIGPAFPALVHGAQGGGW